MHILCHCTQLQCKRTLEGKAAWFAIKAAPLTMHARTITCTARGIFARVCCAVLLALLLLKQTQDQHARSMQGKPWKHRALPFCLVSRNEWVWEHDGPAKPHFCNKVQGTIGTSLHARIVPFECCSDTDTHAHFAAAQYFTNGSNKCAITQWSRGLKPYRFLDHALYNKDANHGVGWYRWAIEEDLLLVITTYFTFPW